MKIRTDFVTNSSSSSFCVEINFEMNDGSIVGFEAEGANGETGPINYFNGPAVIKLSPKQLGTSKNINELIEILTNSVFDTVWDFKKNEPVEVKLFEKSHPVKTEWGMTSDAYEFIAEIRDNIHSVDDIKSIVLSCTEEGRCEEIHKRVYKYSLKTKEYTGEVVGCEFESEGGCGTLELPDLDCCKVEYKDVYGNDISTYFVDNKVERDIPKVSNKSMTAKIESSNEKSVEDIKGKTFNINDMFTYFANDKVERDMPKTPNKSSTATIKSSTKKTVEDFKEKEAKMYGVEVKDLDKHKKYLAAKIELSNAINVEDLKAVKKIFKELNNYRGSKECLRECEERIAAEALKGAKEKEQEEKVKQEHCEKVIAECNGKVAAFKSALNDSSKMYIENFVAELNSTIAHLEKEKAELEKYLASLSFIRILEKKSTNDKIFAVSNKLSKIKAPEFLAAEKKNAKKIVDHTLNGYKTKIDDYINKRFPGLTPKLPKDNNLQVKVLKALSKDEGKTVSQIMADTNIKSSGEVNALIKKMYSKGYLERAEVNCVAHFYITKEGLQKLEHPKKPDGKINYKESEKYAALPCPNPPQIDDLFPIIKI